MLRKHRHFLKRQYVRLQGWLTLGSIGITPRLIIAFVSVAALVATANLIVNNGVAILEQQRTEAIERSAVDARQIGVLRESVGRARHAVMSAEVLGALSEFDRAAQEHSDMDSRTSAARFTRAGTALDAALTKYLEGNDTDQGQLSRVITEHKGSADALVQSRRARRDLLMRYAALLTTMDLRVRNSIELALKSTNRSSPRDVLQEVRSDLDAVRAAFAARGAFDARELDTSPLAGKERALTSTLTEHDASLRRSAGLDWYRAMTADVQTLTITRVALFENEERRLAANDAFARESRRIATLLPPTFEAPPEVAVQVEQKTPAPGVIPGPGAERRLVGWVSIVVLLVLFYLCAATIFSIVRPVRRLLAATNRLARGGNARVVATGGIRELDRLTDAFNSMAQQLAVAREATLDAHQKLEAKVEERTRQLQELAERDPLTGIANRRQLFVALNATLERAHASGQRVGVFFLDIDNFKTLNDCMGHPYGDRVLVAIARRLEAIAQGHGFAARLGGDEFTIVHEAADSADELLAFGASIVRSFESPLMVDEREVIMSVSVGVSVSPDHERDAEALLRAADAALFRAKALGRSQLACFTPELLTTAAAKFAIEQKMRRALRNGEFELFYQPVLDLQTMEVIQVEALIRWRQPDGTVQAPQEFLSVAEESGLVVDISEWVLRAAIQTTAHWYRGPWPDARVSINVSPRQFLDFHFCSKLEALLKEFALPASCIELELTESVLQTGPQTIKALEQLSSIGISVALDDFGTGYSSLASLQHLPLTRVKLDRSLIARIDESARDASIARATIALCRGLGLELTAEGVERVEQFAMLLPHRAISLQGFLFSRPVPSAELISLLQKMPLQCRELLELSKKVVVPEPPVPIRDRRRRQVGPAND